MTLVKNGVGARYGRFPVQIRVMCCTRPIIVFLLLASTGWAGPQLDRAFTSSLPKRATWGYSVADVATGRSLTAHHGDRLFIPASNQKLITVAAALLRLGDDYRSHTEFWALGPIQDGVLHGDLLVRAYGAVHFTARFPRASNMTERQARLGAQLDKLAAQLRHVGIATVAGQLRADSSDWTDMPVNAHYACVGPLSFNENTIDVHVENGVVATCPPPLGFDIVDKSFAGTQRRSPKPGQRNRIVVNRNRSSKDYWRLEGMNASDYYVGHISSALAQRGITIQRQAVRNSDATLLFKLASLSIADLAIETGVYSDNYRAELMYLNLGFELGGKANYQDAAAAMRAIWAPYRLFGTKTAMADGSGLSRQNQVRPNDLTRLLNFMYRSPHRDLFLRSLPVAGETGTLRKRFKNSPAAGRLYAKTGTLRDVTALSGYVYTRSNRLLAFSVLINNCRDKKAAWTALERVGAILYEWE